MAAQAREKEEQLEELLIRQVSHCVVSLLVALYIFMFIHVMYTIQEEIEKTNRELAEKAREEKIAKRELLKELENAQLKITSKDSDIKELKEHLYIQDESRQRLVVEVINSVLQVIYVRKIN